MSAPLPSAAACPVSTAGGGGGLQITKYCTSVAHCIWPVVSQVVCAPCAIDPGAPKQFCDHAEGWWILKKKPKLGVGRGAGAIKVE